MAILVGLVFAPLLPGGERPLTSDERTAARQYYDPEDPHSISNEALDSRYVPCGAQSLDSEDLVRVAWIAGEQVAKVSSGLLVFRLGSSRRTRARKAAGVTSSWLEPPSFFRSSRCVPQNLAAWLCLHLLNSRKVSAPELLGFRLRGDPRFVLTLPHCEGLDSQS